MGFGATFVGRFGREFWQGILEGSLSFKATFIKRFGKAFVEMQASPLVSRAIARDPSLPFMHKVYIRELRSIIAYRQ